MQRMDNIPCTYLVHNASASHVKPIKKPTLKNMEMSNRKMEMEWRESKKETTEKGQTFLHFGVNKISKLHT
jgi:hypothetical protein